MRMEHRRPIWRSMAGRYFIYIYIYLYIYNIYIMRMEHRRPHIDGAAWLRVLTKWSAHMNLLPPMAPYGGKVLYVCMYIDK